MKKTSNGSIQAFVESDIDDVKNYTFKFAKEITKAILDDNEEEIEKLIGDSVEIRDNVEIKEKIERNKEFYYGYWYAYENIANRIFEHKYTNQNIQKIIESNENLRSLVKFLYKEKAAKQKDIAKFLEMKPNELANFMNTDYVQKADILSKNKIGRNVIYSLNAKGRRYFEDHTSEVKTSK